MGQSAIYTPLRRRADFQRVHAQGRRKGDARLQVRVAPTPATAKVQTPLRLGILVTKKYGNAVQRNRFKRLVRAALRSLGAELPSGWDILVLPRAAADAKMPDIRESLRWGLRELGLLAPAAPIDEGGD